MLYAITYELREKLEARKVPFPVVYGPERMKQSALVESHIVIERDRGAGDQPKPPPTIHRNPQAVMSRDLGAVCRVFARSTLAGASPGHHERMADKIIDQVLLAMREIMAGRKSRWTAGPGRFLTAEELEQIGLEQWPGVVYEQQLTVGRAVLDRPFDDEANAETIPFGDAQGPTLNTTLDTSDSPGMSSDLPGATTR